MAKEPSIAHRRLSKVLLLKSLVKGHLIFKNPNELGKLVGNINDEHYGAIFESFNLKVNSNLLPSLGLANITTSETFNLLSKYLFVVSDLDGFIKSIKNNVDRDINQGHKGTRGRVNRADHIVSNVDTSFRVSLLNHKRAYLEYYKINSYDGRYLHDKLFLYDNIHVNLGSW